MSEILFALYFELFAPETLVAQKQFRAFRIKHGSEEKFHELLMNLNQNKCKLLHTASLNFCRGLSHEDES